VTLPPAGWYPDPSGPSRTRYWNGQQWTEHFGPPAGGGQFAPVAVGAYGMTVQQVRYESTRTLGKVVMVMLGICAVVAIVGVFVSLDRAALASDFLDDPGSVTLSEANSADDRVEAVGLLGVGAVVITAIVWVVWFQRCYKNAQSMGALDLRFSSGWAAGAWFVPFLNLVRPKQIADDIWKATDPTLPLVPNREWIVKPRPRLLDFWWGFFVAGSIISRIAFSAGNDTESLSTLRTLDRLSAFTDVVMIVAAVLAALVVKSLNERAHQRAVALGIAA
jgi:hypothetical protein